MWSNKNKIKQIKNEIWTKKENEKYCRNKLWPPYTWQKALPPLFVHIPIPFIGVCLNEVALFICLYDLGQPDQPASHLNINSYFIREQGMSQASLAKLGQPGQMGWLTHYKQAPKKEIGICQEWWGNSLLPSAIKHVQKLLSFSTKTPFNPKIQRSYTHCIWNTTKKQRET